MTHALDVILTLAMAAGSIMEMAHIISVISPTARAIFFGRRNCTLVTSLEISSWSACGTSWLMSVLLTMLSVPLDVVRQLHMQGLLKALEP